MLTLYTEEGVLQMPERQEHGLHFQEALLIFCSALFAQISSNL